MKLTEDDITTLGGPEACKRLQTKGFLAQDNQLTPKGIKMLAKVRTTLADGVAGVPAEKMGQFWLHNGFAALVKGLQPWQTLRCFNTAWLATDSFALYGKKLPGINPEECQRMPETTAKAMRFLMSKTERLRSRPYETPVTPHTFQIQEAHIGSPAIVWLANDAQDYMLPVNASYIEIAKRRFPTVAFYAKQIKDTQDKTVLLGYVTSRGLGGIVAVVAPLTIHLIPADANPNTIIPEKRLDWKGGDIGGKTN